MRLQLQARYFGNRRLNVETGGREGGVDTAAIVQIFDWQSGHADKARRTACSIYPGIVNTRRDEVLTKAEK